MDPKKTLTAVCEILATIQKRQGLPCPELNGDIKPLKDLERFDSPMSLAATGKIGRRLGIEIAPGTNLFGDASSKYTIGKTVALLCKIAENTPKEPAGA